MTFNIHAMKTKVFKLMRLLALEFPLSSSAEATIRTGPPDPSAIFIGNA